MKRTYVVQGRNGYFAVDAHNDQDSGVAGPLFTGTRKQATAVAGVLNAAYTLGREDQAADSRDLVERAYVAGQQEANRDQAGFSRPDVPRETVTGS